jgi:ParB-like chromosome segregation protein Spo0J
VIPLASYNNKQTMSDSFVSLKVAAEKKIHGDSVSKVTSFAVDPRLLEVEEGFNARPLNMEHVAEMSLALQNGAIFPPLEVRVEEGHIILVDGHHRHAAALDAISKGFEIKSLDCRQFRGGDADRVAHMITSAGGLPLTPLQLGIQLRKLHGFGWTEKQIATRIGKSIEHVKNTILLAEANSDVHKAVNAGEVSSTTAAALVKKHGSKAGKVIQDGVAKAKASGKTKATPKMFAEAATERGPLVVTLEWIPVATRLPDDDITVLVALTDGKVSLMYRDGLGWRAEDGMPIEPERVTYWTHVPAAPITPTTEEKTPA